MKKVLPIIFLIICSSAFSFNGWLGIKNEKFTIFYKAEHEYSAKEIMRSLNELSSIAERTTGHKLKRVYLVIDDFGNVVNGFADPTHSDSIHVFAFSPDSRELAMSENWYKTVGIHEYTHMLQIKNSSGIPDALSTIFGSNASIIFSVYPNLSVPPWILEGITTYTESQFSKYSGRLNDGYFDAYLLSRLKEGNRVHIGDITYSSLDYPYGSYYLYGGLFFRYLSQTYGEKKMSDFFDKQGGSLLSYLSPVLPMAGLDLHCKSVYGKSFPDLWNEWQDFEIKRAETFKQDGDRISDFNDRISGSRIYQGYLYFIRNYIDFTSSSSSNKKNAIFRKNLTTNKEELFFEYTSSIYPDLLFKDNSLYFAVNNYTTGFKNSSQNSFGANKRVYKMDLSSKKYIEILNDNIRAFTVCNNEDIIFTADKKESFGSDIYRYNISDKSKSKIASAQMLINEILDYNDKLYVSAKSESANFGVFEFNLSDSSFKKIADTPYLEGQISIYDNKLFFISNNNSQYRSYFVDLETNELFSVTDSGYSTYPSYSKENNTLYYIGINTNGNNIYKKAFSPVKIEFEDYSQSQNSKSDFQDLKYEKVCYGENLLSLLKPTSRYFFFETSKGKNKYTLSFSGSDKVFDIPDYNLSLNYDESEIKNKFNFEFSLTNNLLLPVKNSLYVDMESFGVYFSYPLISNSKPGIQSVNCGILLLSENEFKEKSISPNLSIDIRYPSTSISFNVESPFEGKSFSNSSSDNIGLITSLSATKSFTNSKLNGRVKSIYNPDNILSDNDSNPDVRGYTADLPGSDTVFASLNYSINLFKIRKGLWNPNIYAGDISLNLFADSLFERKNSDFRQLSSGLEFSGLTAFGFGSIDLYPTLRVSFPENKSPVFDFSLLTNF
jgi:hypothetical protein